MLRSRLSSLGCFIILIFWSGTLVCDDSSVRTFAGVVERQLEDEYESRPITPFQQIPALVLDLPDESLEICDDESLYVKRIRICGHTVIPECFLLEACDGFTDCDLTIGDINRLCLALQAMYVRKGYFLARAFAPEQEICNDELLIRIVEGNLGSIDVIGNCHYSAKFIAGYFAHMQGCPIKYADLIYALLLLNENDYLDAEVIFKKGSCPGTADIIVKVADRLPFSLYADVNNYGIQAISRLRYGARVDYGNILFDGDVLSIADVFGRTPNLLTFIDVIYSVPLNARGTYLELSYIRNFFNVPKPKHLQLNGNSTVAEISLSQALIRTRDTHVDCFVSFDYKQLKNNALKQIVTFDKLRVATIGFSSDMLDCYGGRNLSELDVSFGIPHFLGGSREVGPLFSRDGSGAKYTIVHANYRRLQALPLKRSYLLISLFGQYTGYELPLAEQFYIGGFDTVRGFSMAKFIADNGYCSNLELHIPPFFLTGHCVPYWGLPWEDVLQFVAFIDHGAVKYNGKDVDSKKYFTLTGAGVGLRLIGPWNTNLTIDVGFPLDHRRHASAATLYFKFAFEM